MEDLYRIMDAFCSDDQFNSTGSVGNNNNNNNNNIIVTPIEESDDQIFHDNNLFRTQITSHPRYPSLVSAYIECRKLGAPPEIVSFLDEVCREVKINTSCTDMGTDPELDEFMEKYCLFFINYKDELSRPLTEFTTFLANIERQLHQLFNETSTTTVNAIIRHSDEATGSSEEEQSCVDVEASSLNSKTSGATAAHGDQALKEMLLHKYSGCLSHLKTQFLTKKKKGKLPKDSRTVLLDWWNTHYRWPYPTEEEKMKLVEITGLNQKQITNWFINQRKRHWKPSEDQCWALMNGLSDAGDGPSMYFNSTVEGIVSD